MASAPKTALKVDDAAETINTTPRKGLPIIVAIHGSAQNPEAFRIKTGSIRTQLKKKFDFDFIR